MPVWQFLRKCFGAKSKRYKDTSQLSTSNLQDTESKKTELNKKKIKKLKKKAKEAKKDEIDKKSIQQPIAIIIEKDLLTRKSSKKRKSRKLSKKSRKDEETTLTEKKDSTKKESKKSKIKSKSEKPQENSSANMEQERRNVNLNEIYDKQMPPPSNPFEHHPYNFLINQTPKLVKPDLPPEKETSPQPPSERKKGRSKINFEAPTNNIPVQNKYEQQSLDINKASSMDPISQVLSRQIPVIKVITDLNKEVSAITIDEKIPSYKSNESDVTNGGIKTLNKNLYDKLLLKSILKDNKMKIKSSKSLKQKSLDQLSSTETKSGTLKSKTSIDSKASLNESKLFNVKSSVQKKDSKIASTVSTNPNTSLTKFIRKAQDDKKATFGSKQMLTKIIKTYREKNKIRFRSKKE